MSKELKELIEIGNYMSNILYNLKHDPCVPDPTKKTAKEFQEKWDSAYNFYLQSNQKLYGTKTKKRRKNKA